MEVFSRNLALTRAYNFMRFIQDSETNQKIRLTFASLRIRDLLAFPL
jgi:hypothetical protein